MKNLSEEAIIFIGFFVVLFAVVVFDFGTDAYDQYLKTYNTQKDREMFLKSYEIVLECRKDASVINMDKVCGTVPVFVNKVK